MAVKITYDKELNQLIKYLKSEESEDAKRPLIFHQFQKLFKDKFHSESAAGGAADYIGKAAEKIIVLIQKCFEDDQKKAGKKEKTSK